MSKDISGSWECPACNDGAVYWDPVKYGITTCDVGHVIHLLYAEDGRMAVRLADPSRC